MDPYNTKQHRLDDWIDDKDRLERNDYGIQWIEDYPDGWYEFLSEEYEKSKSNNEEKFVNEIDNNYSLLIDYLYKYIDANYDDWLDYLEHCYFIEKEPDL